MPGLSDIKTEYELYTYLKDGTELVAIRGDKANINKKDSAA